VYSPMSAATSGSALWSLQEGTSSVHAQGNRWVSVGLGLGFGSPAEDGCMLWWRLCQRNSCLMLGGKLAGRVLIGESQPCQSDHFVTAYVPLSTPQAWAGGVTCWGRGKGAKPAGRVDLQAVLSHFFFFFTHLAIMLVQLQRFPPACLCSPMQWSVH